MTTNDKILVTGASGQLGRFVVEALLRTVPANRIAVLARNPAAVRDLAARGVDVRQGDYGDPAALDRAFAGVGKALLISSSEVGQRIPQHRNVIEAAARAGVGLLAYTSILHADANQMALAPEHRETEALIRASGLPYVFLRNGWYSENYTGAIGAVLAHGALPGAAGQGRISAAARRDYAEAAAAVLAAAEGHAGKVYELAGDEAFTLADYAAEISRQSGREIAFQDLTEADYRGVLVSAGLPEALAASLADADAWAAKGALYEPGRQLSALIGRPTTPIADSVRAALA